MREMRTILTLREFRTLSEASEGRGKKMTVSRESIRRLLCDHSKLLGLTRDLGLNVIHPEDKVPPSNNEKDISDLL